MMLRIGTQFLDFNGDVEMESQVKLFEELDSTYGDYSYAFDLPYTQNNLNIIGLPFPDNSAKIIYRNVTCDLLDNEGVTIFTGLLRVQALLFNRQIIATFYSGNYNWISSLTGVVSDLYFEDLNLDLEAIYIVNINNILAFPLVDNGALITRSSNDTKVQDYMPAVYLRIIFERIFNSVGIKLKGDLMSDFIYNRAIVLKCLSNTVNIDDRTSFVQKGSDQTVISGAAVAAISFTDDSTYPYSDGASNNFNTSTYRYTADKKMTVKVDITMVVGLNNAADRMYIVVRKNSATFKSYTITPVGSPSDQSNSYTFVTTLEATDYLDLTVQAVAFLGLNTVIRGTSTIKVTPTFVFSFKGNEIVPNWTKQEFVSNVLNLMNVIVDYDPNTKELTLDFFDNIKSKTPVDLTDYVNVTESNFEELISNFGKQNLFGYQESEDEELKKYNVGEFVKYGQGVINVDNDYIAETAEIVSSKFKAPISYINGAFSMSMERVNFLELEEGDTTNFTSVSDVAGEARFNGINNIVADNDLIRITESSNSAYNGDWIAHGTGAGTLLAAGISYDSNATGKITALNYKYTNSDDVFIMINTGSLDVADFSGLDQIGIDRAYALTLTYAYFNLLNINQPVNTWFEQGLSFGSVNNPLSYQRSLLDTYWRSVAPILNDPVKIKVIAYLPKAVYLSLTPLSPVTIKTGETSNLYYINRKRGYKSQSKPCEIELIKLS